MSRSISPAAIKAMFNPDSDQTIITLVTIKQDASIGVAADVRFADNYTQRLSETSEEVYYGVISNGVEYPFIPIEITLPNDDNTAAPRCTIAIHDVTRILLPQIRALTGAPKVELALVLNSTPSTIEATFTGFKLTNISYNANTITAELTMPGLEVEPFPIHSFTPAYFPGMF